MLLRITKVNALTSSIRLIRLEHPGGAPLPAFDAGAHIAVGFKVGDEAVVRKYSLVSDGSEPRHYEVAIKRNASGRGGSLFLHDHLAIGDVLEVSHPVNEFSVAPNGAHYVLIAGGIGITPMLGIAAQLKTAGASYALHYSARSEDEMAFRDQLQRDREHVSFYFTGADQTRRVDVERLLDACKGQGNVHVYVCGPAKLIDAVRLAAEKRGIDKHQVHFESFGPAWEAADGKVRLALTESALELEVAPGTTLLDAIESAGAWIPSDCRRGECGACIASYTGGKPIHRDNCLTEEQRLHSFCPCVSWASTDEVLSLQI